MTNNAWIKAHLSNVGGMNDDEPGGSIRNSVGADPILMGGISLRIPYP